MLSLRNLYTCKRIFVVDIDIESKSFLYLGSGNEGKFDPFRPLKIGCHFLYGFVGSELCFGGLFP